MNRYEIQRLTTSGMNAAIQFRLDLGLGLTEPICVYQACASLGIKVRFVPVNMEGMYQRGSPRRIHISSMRPAARQKFSCGHELGHDRFGHGSKILELPNSRTSADRELPDEVLVNAFSAFLLMPTLGLRQALARRAVDSTKIRPMEIFRVASEYGVGYRTLVNHLAYGLGMVSYQQAEKLNQESPKSIRASISDKFSESPLTIVDRYWEASFTEIQVGSFALLPRAVEVDAAYLERTEIEVKDAAVYRAIRPGKFVAHRKESHWSTEVRIAPKNFVGMAEYRFFEELDDDEEN